MNKVATNRSALKEKKAEVHQAKDGIRLSLYPQSRFFGIILAISVLFIVELFYLNVSLFDIIAGFPAFLEFFFTKFFPPNFNHINEYIPLMIETINYAVVATIFSSLIALLLAVAMSSKTNPIMPIRYGIRFFVTLFRNIPVIILASILVYIFGIGAVSGIIALIFATLAFLARAFAESLDDIPAEKLEALKAVGANKPQIFFECILPNFVPLFLDWFLYIFQINILASVLLGLVGAGGIGMMVQNNLRLFKFNTAFAVIIIIVTMVVTVELITNKIRKLIR